MSVKAGYPYAVFVANKMNEEMIFVKWIGAPTRAPTHSEFEDLAQKMMGAKAMKSMPEKIIKVNAPHNMYIAYRREDNLGVIFFVFAPLSYNKGVMRKFLREFDESFRTSIEECKIDDDKLASMGSGVLNNKSIIRNAVLAVVEKHGEGIALTDQILAQIEKNKALMEKNIDSMAARNAALEDQVKLSEQLVDLASQFADKAQKIKEAMCWKRVKMTILMCLVAVALLALIAWKLGLFDE